jgi:RNA polymerase sigma-70 factor (ECF subfamily)
MDVAGYAIEQDSQLMLSVRDGDTHSFAVLLERHRVPVIHFLYRMVQNQAVAEELAQEAFLRIYKSRATYEPTAKFTTWLFRISMHLALNWIRDERYAQNGHSLDVNWNGNFCRQLPDRAPSIEDCLLREARAEEIRGAISLLPAKQRLAVLMHKYQEMDYAQIAAVLRCSDSAVKSLLFRAYERLRSRLGHMEVRRAHHRHAGTADATPTYLSAAP